MKAAVRLTSRHSRASAPRPHPSDAPFVCIAQCSHVAMHGAPCISLSLLLLQSFSVRGSPLVPPPLSVSRSRIHTPRPGINRKSRSRITILGSSWRGQPEADEDAVATVPRHTQYTFQISLSRGFQFGYCVRVSETCTLHISLHTGHTDSRTHGALLVDDPRCSPAWAPLPSPSPPPRLRSGEWCARWCAVVCGDARASRGSVGCPGSSRGSGFGGCACVRLCRLQGRELGMVVRDGCEGWL